MRSLTMWSIWLVCNLKILMWRNIKKFLSLILRVALKIAVKAVHLFQPESCFCYKRSGVFELLHMVTNKLSKTLFMMSAVAMLHWGEKQTVQTRTKERYWWAKQNEQVILNNSSQTVDFAKPPPCDGQRLYWGLFSFWHSSTDALVIFKQC